MLWVTPNIKHYKLNSITSKPTLLKPSLAIDHQMAMTQVQVGIFFIKDVLLDDGYVVNTITEKLKVQLCQSNPKPTSYNLHMVDQTIPKPLTLIKDLKILVNGIPYVITFILTHSSVLYFGYSTLLGHPWLRDHNWVITLSPYKELVQSKLYMLPRNLKQ